MQQIQPPSHWVSLVWLIIWFLTQFRCLIRSQRDPANPASFTLSITCLTDHHTPYRQNTQTCICHDHHSIIPLSSCYCCVYLSSMLSFSKINALICLHRSSRDGRNNNSCYSTCQVSSLLIFLKAINFLSLNVVLFISILSLILFVWKLSTKNVSLNK